MILTASALFLSGVSESAEPKEAEPQSKETQLEHNKADGQPKTTNKPSIFDQYPEPPGGRTAAQQQTNKKETKPRPPTDYGWWFNFWLVIFTGCLVLVGIGQIVVYAIQARYMWHGLGLTGQTVTAANISAKAAQKSADIVDKSLTLLERAWLIVRFDLPFQLVWSERTRVRYAIINTGRSIARFKHAEAFVTTQEGFPDLPVINIDRAIYNTTKAVIFPSTPMEQSGETQRILESGTIEGIRNGSIKLIIRGFVVYDDIFDMRHVTKFCQVYSPTWNDGRGGFVMPPEPKSGYENDAD